MLDESERLGEIHPALLSQPELIPGLEYIWTAFLLLAMSRPASFEVGYIPLTELECYCRIYEIDGEDRDFLLWVFREVDLHYIELTHAKNAANKKK